MNKNWNKCSNLKCVVLCAGEGRRLRPHTATTPKVLEQVGKYPVLRYVVDYWRRFTQDFIFVVHYKKEEVVKFVQTLPVNHICVEQKELRGIADALSYAQPYATDKLVLALGDCICDGEFLLPNNMEQGVAIWETEDCDAIRRSYSVEIDRNGLVVKVVEKPDFLPNKWCGLGYYFLDRRVFDYIKATKPSALRGEVEITDVIQNMINSGEKISGVTYKGNYMNITYPKDLQLPYAITV